MTTTAAAAVATVAALAASAALILIDWGLSLAGRATFVGLVGLVLVLAVGVVLGPDRNITGPGQAVASDFAATPQEQEQETPLRPWGTADQVAADS